MRYTFIQKLCKKCVVKSKESKEHKRSVAIDRVLTHRIAAIPLFLAIMCAIFYITFELLGAWLSDLLALGIDALKGVVIGALEKYGLNAAALSFLSEGVFDGVGSVLSFLPFIVVLFFFLSLLEDSGYMARVAFIMDKPLRKIGLSGKSFVPLLMGFGCSVPAIMATRTLSSERDKKLTVMLIPFVSCSAKIVVYSAIASCGLFSHPTLVIFALYLIGILLGILVALALKATAFRGKPIPFVMELPNYRLPSAKSTALLLWDKAKDFIEKAFTVIFLATCIIWFFKSFDTRLLFVGEETERSMLARLGEWVLPLFRPIGVADGSAVASLIAGFSAKEAVIGTLSMLSSDVTTLFSGAAGAFGFLVFVLLYTPCVAAVSTVKKELGSWTKTLGIVAMQCGIAYVAALAFYQIGALL